MNRRAWDIHRCGKCRGVCAPLELVSLSRTVQAVVVVALVAALASSRPAIASLPQAHAHVTPEHGVSDTTFVLSFVAPTTTGTSGAMQVHDVLSASGHPASASCLGSVDVPITDHRRGQRMLVRLNPRKLGGHWCLGTFHGQIEELAQPVCPHGEACPTYVILRGTIARFELHVQGHPSGRTRDITAPRFAGIQSAFACTPGPQRPGQTTPYTLAWEPATDNVTPTSQIVYDVFYASAPRGEHYSRPNWITTPGTTSFRTPGLPSHASAYFVVRARNTAGREDANTIERAGVDPCL
jgi:hypothetical protein